MSERPLTFYSSYLHFYFLAVKLLKCICEVFTVLGSVVYN